LTILYGTEAGLHLGGQKGIDSGEPLEVLFVEAHKVGDAAGDQMSSAMTPLTEWALSHWTKSFAFSSGVISDLVSSASPLLSNEKIRESRRRDLFPPPLFGSKPITSRFL
jgi:hypothetical protein